MTHLSSLTHNTLLPGTAVRARGLTWEVVQAEPAGEELRYRLRCTQGDLRGHEIDLLSPFERIEPLSTALDPRKAGRLKEWLLFHEAFLLEQALGPAALLATQPGRLTIAPYQLVPVMRALSMTRPRLLLADGVGLGKTIEAGLIIAELIARRRAHRVLIISPAGPLLQQWRAAMRFRFGLRFETILDWGALQEKRRELILGANPFDQISLCLLSIDFAKQEKVLQDLERTQWDVVIIDEAHHCFQLGTVGDGEDSRRRRLAEVLSRQSDGLLLLTATPHDGYDAHFASLMDLLDPSLLDGRGALRGDRFKKQVIRRLKHHVKDPVTGKELFKKRIVTPSPVVFGPDSHPRFSAFQKTLLALVAPHLKTAVRKRRFGEVLAFVSLLKRSVSTVRACRNTLQVIADRYAEMLAKGEEAEEYRKQRLRTLTDYRRRIQRYGALSSEEEADQAMLEAEDMAALLRREGFAGTREHEETLAAAEHELKLESRRERAKQKSKDAVLSGLEALITLAEAAESQDPKLEKIVDAIQEIRSSEPLTNVLVYTEYADSQAVTKKALETAIKNGRLTGSVLSIRGEDGDADREKVIRRFELEDDLILVSTDATAEGLDLHTRCHQLLHLELPYNPNRLEQRNGRIDRYGQRFEPRVRYLYLAGTFEERVLLRLVAKYEKQRERLTFVPDTFGAVALGSDRCSERLLEGLSEEDGLLFKREENSERVFEAAREDTASQAAYKDLLAEIERAVGGYEKSAKAQDWLGEAGLNAESKRLEEANRAMTEGSALGGFDLLRFVCEAIESESRSTDTVRKESDRIFSLRIPSGWTHGIDELPGWDSEARVLRVTTDPNLVSDAQGRPLGYLGRAHAVVRRALERARNIPIVEGSAALDRRVSVVSGDGPALLYTFLCTVMSDSGREFERVIAARFTPYGEVIVLSEPENWLQYADRKRALASAGIWEKHFMGWADSGENASRGKVSGVFDKFVRSFESTLENELDLERRDLAAWLSIRATEICGSPIAQLSLLGGQDVPSWKSETDPVARLASFYSDSSNPPAQRRESSGVIALFESRRKLLERRSRRRTLPPVTLGMLMIVPEGVKS